MHALIIEDEALIAMAIEDILGKCGFTSFDLAASPEPAIAFAKIRCPDLITSDVELKPGCGISTVMTICQDIVIPLIFITGNVAEVLRRMPHARTLQKPFSDEQLSAQVALAMA